MKCKNCGAELTCENARYMCSYCNSSFPKEELMPLTPQSKEFKIVGGVLLAYLGTEAPKIESEASRLAKDHLNQAIAEEKRQKRRKQNIAMIISFVMMLLGLGAILTIVLYSYGIPSSKYDYAMDLKEKGMYTEAIAAFEELGDYKDSKLQIKKCNKALIDGEYNAAIELYNSGKYAEAIAAFEELGNYKDSKLQIEKARKDEKYDAALSLYSNGNCIEAIAALEELGDYKDSAAKISEIKASPEYENYLLKIAKVGDTIFFGSYEQNNNISDGKEKIEWKILAKEGTKILVVSKCALDCQKFNSSLENVTWETCSLRTWLNGTFYNTAFSSAEKAKIVKTTVEANKNPNYNTNPGKSTVDNVFLLSITEANKYFLPDTASKCLPTAYAIAQGAYTSDKYTLDGQATTWWWLRSPGGTQNAAASVYSYGPVDCKGDKVNRDAAVRPALWISFDS